jgi:ubiquinol-cytochrome c reductase subunit 6
VNGTLGLLLRDWVFPRADITRVFVITSAPWSAVLDTSSSFLTRLISRRRARSNLHDAELTRQIAPAIREHCEKTQCVEPAKHFQHCAEKVEGGKGWQGEDCVEELFHLMHCVDVSYYLRSGVFETCWVQRDADCLIYEGHIHHGRARWTRPILRTVRELGRVS